MAEQTLIQQSPPATTEDASAAAIEERGSWRVVAASAVGVSHEATGTPCQDWGDARRLAGDLLLVAVADGAGSAERSDAGARRAVETALAALAVRFGNQTPEDRPGAIRAAVAEARAGLVQLAAAENQPLAAYATTLTCLVAWPSGAVVGRIGDGFAIVQDEAGGLCPVPPSRPDRGEYANETVFLTSPTTTASGDGDDRLEIAEVEGPVRALAVSSDGLLRLAMELTAYRPHAAFFRPLFAFAAEADSTTADGQLAAFLASDRVRARTDDDVTLVLAVLDERGAPDDGG